jgi:hypothetical protein
MAGKQIEFVAGSGINLTGNAGEKKIQIETKNATETVVGAMQLATAAEVQQRTNATKAIVPARVSDVFNKKYADDSAIFSAFDPRTMMGVAAAPFLPANAATTKTPFYELYGIAPPSYGKIYVVETFGVGRVGDLFSLRQTATDAETGRVFTRKANVWSTEFPNWSKWVEMSTLSFHPGSLTLIVDGTNGDDATANGTEARPYQTIQAALNAIPRYFVDVVVKIKPGTYDEAPKLTDKMYTGKSLSITSFSGKNDVVISRTSTGSVTTLSLSNFSSNVSVSYMTVVIKDPSNGYCGIRITNTFFPVVKYCDITGVRTSGALGGIAIQNCSVASVSNCCIDDSNIGISISNCGTCQSTDNSNGDIGLKYGLSVWGSVIRRHGTQPQGTVANTSIYAGGQIL